MRCEVEAEAALASAPRVRLAEGTTVVALVLAEEAGDFQRNWLTWNFTPGTPVLVLLAGMSAEELWLPGAGENVRVLPCAGDLESVLGVLAETVQTRLVTFLPGTAAVLPGAELWRGGEAPVLHATEAGEKERETTGNDFIPATIFAQVEVATLREVAPTARGCALSEWPKFLHRTASIAGLRREDAGGLGWKFPAVYRLLGRSPMERTVVAVRESRKGLLELADEVVVVSLPERMDRRNRIVAMMAEEKVAFRFVDGVRVRDEDILPEEIEEVGRLGFKEVGTFEKYLRGMVGCRRAHLRVLERAYADGLDSLLILEDDAHLETGWLKHYQMALGELPMGWLQLYLSGSEFRGGHDFSKTLRRLSAAYQTTAILYSKAGIEAALNCLRHSRSEIDHWMGNHLHPFGNCYLIRPSIAYQEGGVSDIMSFDRGVTA